MKTQNTDKATAIKPFVIHYEKLTVQEPFVVIQQNRDEYTNQLWLREIPVSNLQERNGSVSVKFMGGWYPLASQRDIEHAALVAVANTARNLLNSTPSDNWKTPEQVSLLWKVEEQLQNLAKIRGG